MNLYLTTLKNEMRWEIVAVTGQGEIRLESREHFEAVLDILWAFRFKNAQYVYVKNIRKNGCVASYSAEDEAIAFFKKHWPNCSDFVWANRH